MDLQKVVKQRAGEAGKKIQALTPETFHRLSGQAVNSAVQFFSLCCESTRQELREMYVNHGHAAELACQEAGAEAMEALDTESDSHDEMPDEQEVAAASDDPELNMEAYTVLTHGPWRRCSRLLKPVRTSAKQHSQQQVPD